MVFFFGGEVIIVIAVIIFLIIALLTTGLVGMCNWALAHPDMLAMKIFLIFLILSFLTALIASDNYSNHGIKRFFHCLFISVPSSAGITAGLLYCIYLICGYVTASEWDEMAIIFFIIPLIQIFFIIFLCLIALAIGAFIGVAPAFGIDDASNGVFQSLGLSALASVIPFGLIALFTYLISNDMFKIFFLVQY